jgi:hypothetical protein
VDLGGGTPLTDQPAQWAVAVQLRRGDGHARELVRERAPVDTRQELDPRECVGEGLVQGLAVVHGEVAQSSAERHQCDRPLSLTVGSGQVEVRLIAAAEQDVTLLEIAGNLVGVAKQVGERPFDDTHGSQLYQKKFRTGPPRRPVHAAASTVPRRLWQARLVPEPPTLPPRPRRPRPATRAEPHTWEFKPRFRRHAFGWRSQPAIQRIKEAVREIKRVARTDACLAADGAVALLERLSPALEQVDGSSGAIGSAVNNAIAELVPIIATAPANPATREAWLERLWAAHEADEMPYIEQLADHWGELCASKEVASQWADNLARTTRLALSRDRRRRAHFHGTSACLSALFRAERFQEIVTLLETDTIWPYQRWAVKALAAMGRKSEAIRYAERCRGPWTYDGEVDVLCEEILLSSGLVDEAYARYGIAANRRGTYAATFRAVATKYPHKPVHDVLADLVASTPGEEGKWFAAAKDAGLLDQALAFAETSPTDPRTLTRAARDMRTTAPDFAVRSGLLALHWLGQGYGYEITSADVLAAYAATMSAAEMLSKSDEIRRRVRELIAPGTGDGFMAKVLTWELDE